MGEIVAKAGGNGRHFHMRIARRTRTIPDTVPVGGRAYLSSNESERPIEIKEDVHIQTRAGLS